jgi:hypothetical protein
MFCEVAKVIKENKNKKWLVSSTTMAQKTQPSSPSVMRHTPSEERRMRRVGFVVDKRDKARLNA